MQSMINLKASRKTPTINISANPVTNVHVTNRGEGAPAASTFGAASTASTMVHYPDPNQVGEFVSVNPQAATSFAVDPSAFQSDDPEKSKLMRENAVLKLIIDIQHNNPIIVNKYIIADDATLIKLVSLLCNATEVHIDADDVSCGCTTKNTYRKVHAIFVVVNGETKNLKYDFADVMYTLKELHISTKFVW
jgi:hypothetical protein